MKEFAGTWIFLIGFLLAISEGDWFPYANFAGVVMMFYIVWQILKGERHNNRYNRFNRSISYGNRL